MTPVDLTYRALLTECMHTRAAVLGQARDALRRTEEARTNLLTYCRDHNQLLDDEALRFVNDEVQSKRTAHERTMEEFDFVLAAVVRLKGSRRWRAAVRRVEAFTRRAQGQVH